MAGFVPSPNTVKVDLIWSIHGRFQHNITHGLFETVGPVNPASPENIFSAAKSAFVSSLFDTDLAATTTLAGLILTDLRNSSVPGISSTSSGVVGTSAALALPDQTALVLTLRTSLTGRSHRGRIYTLGWAVSAMLADGTCNPASSAHARAFWDAVNVAMGAEGMPMAIRSPALPERPSKPGGMLPAKQFEITRVSKIEVRDNVWDTNRRRTDTLRR